MVATREDLVAAIDRYCRADADLDDLSSSLDVTDDDDEDDLARIRRSSTRRRSSST